MKTRVLFIMPNLQGGGAEKVFVDILHKLDYDLFDVTVLVMCREGVYESCLPPNVEILSLKGNFLYPPRVIVNRFNYFVWLKYRLRRLVGCREFDVMVSFLEGAPVFAHYCLARGRKCRNLTWVHSDIATDDWTIYFFKKRSRELKSYSIMNQVIAVSSTAATGFKKIIGDKYPIMILPNLIDRKSIIEKSRETIGLIYHGKTLAFIGRLEDVKRPDRFVELISELKRRGVNVNGIMVGTGKMSEALKSRVESEGLLDRIVMTGFKSNPYPYLARATALVITSDSEGDPLVVKEALTLGVPVISTDIKSIRETLDGKGGLISGFTAKELADQAEKIVKTPDLRQKLSEEAVDIARGFDEEKIMAQITGLLTGNKA